MCASQQKATFLYNIKNRPSNCTIDIVAALAVVLCKEIVQAGERLHYNLMIDTVGRSDKNIKYYMSFHKF